MNIAFVVAMMAEAQPFIENFGVKEVPDFFDPLPSKLYHARLGRATDLYVVLNGQQHGSDLIGDTEAASRPGHKQRYVRCIQEQWSRYCQGVSGKCRHVPRPSRAG